MRLVIAIGLRDTGAYISSTEGRALTPFGAHVFAKTANLDYRPRFVFVKPYALWTEIHPNRPSTSPPWNAV